MFDKGTWLPHNSKLPKLEALSSATMNRNTKLFSLSRSLMDRDTMPFPTQKEFELICEFILFLRLKRISKKFNLIADIFTKHSSTVPKD